MSAKIEKIEGLDMSRIPEHVAIIMDGNGRWAKQRSQERTEGHVEGVNSVNRITRFASDLGVKYLTLYAFSTENWHRPEAEVDALMHLIGWTIRKETPELKENNVQIRLLGDIDRLPANVQADLMNGVHETAECTGLKLCLCLSYSSRWELTAAIREIAKEAAEGKVAAEEISEEMISSRLTTSGMPDPDLLIRTGGEYRISNFLLWQIAYSELYFTPTLWPEFGTREFTEALIDYQQRERRYGKTGDQVKAETADGKK
jgi:undecaprenyl diphosphate synthase